ncbi:helix-turn-helix domain-containing protein [Bacteroidales bacterium OttesenSCG-928-M06]|nr:helix-turn-helix domain-containing protein [Bacteroidales bacterium OttesenSCG-928-M06]
MSKEELNQITDLVIDKTLFCTKEVLTTDEAAKYMGISRSYLYKLTSRKEIPHYKPMGKVCYFNRSELECWLQCNRVATATEINDRADAYCRKGGVK